MKNKYSYNKEKQALIKLAFLLVVIATVFEPVTVCPESRCSIQIISDNPPFLLTSFKDHFLPFSQMMNIIVYNLRVI